MPADSENDLLTVLYDVARRMCAFADQMAQSQEMTRAQMLILVRLERLPDVSQNELAAVAEVAPMTIARLVDRLEALGLVQRCADPEDRRVWRLRLTPAATPLLRKIKRGRAKLHSVVTKGTDPAVLDSMCIGLRQIKKNISRRRATEGPPR